MAGKKIVEVPSSKMKMAITRILFEKGYILSYKVVEGQPVNTIKIALKYHPQTKTAAIKKIERVSKPGLRKYAGVESMPRVLNGLGIAIISMHTNLDRSLEARQALCERLGLHALSSLEYPDAPERCGLGALADAEPIALEALSRRAAHAFSTVPRIWGAPDAMVSRIAVLGGSLGDLGELAMKAGAQAIVCGEAGYHVCQDLAARGCAVVLLGHDASELPFAEVLARTVCASGVPTDAVTVMGERRQWWSLDEGALHDNR